MGLGQVKTIQLREVTDSAVEQLQSVLGLAISNVVAASKKEDGWHLKIELVERKAIPDTQDLLGTYDVLLDEEGYMVSYERRKVRRRMDVEEFDKEEEFDK